MEHQMAFAHHAGATCVGRAAFTSRGVCGVGYAGRLSQHRLRGSRGARVPGAPSPLHHSCEDGTSRGGTRTVIRCEGEGGGGGKVPVNAPSSVLLLSSSVLAIAAVGCVFELSGGKPTYGATVTSAILGVSLPGFLFLFYAAIRKGQQEAMDDP